MAKKVEKEQLSEYNGYRGGGQRLYSNRVGGGAGREITSYYLYLGRAAFEQKKMDIKNRYSR